MDDNQSCDKIANGKQNQRDVDRPEEVGTALLLHLATKYENYFGIFSIFCLHLDDRQLFLSTSRRRDWLAIQGETTPRPRSIFNFYFQLSSSSVCVNTAAKSYFCYGDLEGKLFDINDNQRVATNIVPSLLQL